MITRVRRHVAIAALLVGAPLAAVTAESASAAPACNPPAGGSTAMCLDYSVQTVGTGTDVVTTKSQAVIDATVSFTNTSTGWAADADFRRWIDRLTIGLPGASGIEPLVTGTADLPDRLLVAGSAAGCGNGPDFTGCTAGHGTAQAMVKPLLGQPKVHPATFGIHRIYHDRTDLGSHFLQLRADARFCVEAGLVPTCSNHLLTFTVDRPAVGQPLRFDFVVPTLGNAVLAVGLDSGTLRIDGRSATLADGTPASQTYTWLRNPTRCGTVAARATAFGKGGGTVTASHPLSVTDCSQINLNTTASLLRFGQRAVVSGKILDWGDGSHPAPLTNTQVDFYKCDPAALDPTGSCQLWDSSGTDTDGIFAFEDWPTRNTRYFVRVPAAAGNPGNWATKLVKVAPTVSLATSRTSMPSGGTVRLSGIVAPKHAGKAVSIQRVVAGSWKQIGTATLSTTSRYAKSVTLKGARGTSARLRVVLVAHADHASGVSPARLVRFS